MTPDAFRSVATSFVLLQTYDARPQYRPAEEFVPVPEWILIVPPGPNTNGGNVKTAPADERRVQPVMVTECVAALVSWTHSRFRLRGDVDVVPVLYRITSIRCGWIDVGSGIDGLAPPGDWLDDPVVGSAPSVGAGEAEPAACFGPAWMATACDS